jgi:transposase
VIGSTRQVRVYAYRKPADMRKSFNTLAALVVEGLGRDVMSGDIFLFIGRTRKLAKMIYWDGTGLCLFSKRLAKGCFAAPWGQPGDRPLVLTTNELAILLEGSELALRVPLSPPPYAPTERVLRWG